MKDQDQKELHIIPKSEAKRLGMNFYFTGKPCKRGHYSERYVKSSACKECKDQIAKEIYNRDKENIIKQKKIYRKKNISRIKKKEKEYNRKPEVRKRRKKYNKEYRKKNYDRLIVKDRVYREKNHEKCKARQRNYHHKNKESIKNKRKEYFKQYYKDNKDKYYASVAKRRATILQRTIGEFDESIHQIYQEASRLRSEGYNVHVDHIIPLSNDLVSGLHVPWNLQIIPARENFAKNNKFTPYWETF